MSSQLEDAFNEAVERRIREMQTLPPGVWPDTSAQHGVLLDQIRELHQENERLRAASPDERLREALADAERLATALRLTQEYVGDELLPPLPGWSWFDALNAHAALAAADREAPDEETRDG